MRASRSLALLCPLLALAAASAPQSSLLVFSTQRHFADSEPLALPADALPAVLAHLSARDAPAGATLPLSRGAGAAELVVLVTSRAAAPAGATASLHERLAGATGARTPVLRATSAPDLSAVAARREVVAPGYLARLVARDGLLDNGVADVVALAVHSDADVDAAVDAIGAAARGSGGRVAVVWAVHEEDAPAADAVPAPETANGTETANAESAAKKPETAQEPEKPEKTAAELAAEHGGYFPPEIDSAQVAGLAVGFVFLLIFIPGFLCLFSIQTPQTFAMLDSTEMKKKLQ